MTSTNSAPTDGARPIDVRWARRPVLGWSVRAVALVGPIVASVGVAWLLTAVTPTPDRLVVAVARWLAIAASSSLVLVACGRIGRRLLSVADLLDLALIFPDRAPSRFGVALRTGTTAQLRRRIEEAQQGRPTDTPAEAAKRVLELVAALRMHDHITRGHSERVRAYTQMIAEEMGLDETERDRLRWAGLLHDVGKLLVPTSILNKDGRLTDDEFDIIKAHPENGRRIIEPLIPWLGESARAVWEHHEKWDGSGYPNGLAAWEISVAARIVTVADVYDVMTSARSYKDPVSPRQAREELARCAGSHFDPVVVRAFLNLSVGRVRRAAGPVSWLAQLSLFPSAVLSSTQAAGGAAVLTGVLGVSSAGVGAAMVEDAMSAVDPRAALGWVAEPEEPAIDRPEAGAAAADTAADTDDGGGRPSAPAASSTTSTVATSATSGSTTTSTAPVGVPATAAATVAPSTTVATTGPSVVATTTTVPTVTGTTIAPPDPVTTTSLPVTVPTLPVTVPTLPVTVPTLPVTVPTLPVTVPTLPVTVPTIPVTVPTLPIGLPGF